MGKAEQTGEDRLRATGGARPERAPSGPEHGLEPVDLAPSSPERTLEPLDLHRLLVESVRDYAIFMLSPTGHVATWNAGAERIKGYSADEIIGTHFSAFYPEAERAAGKPAWELEVAEREGRVEDEGWRLRSDGTRFWANVVITALRNPEGGLVGFAKVTRDLSERRAAEQRALEDARRVAAAEAASRAKAEFLTSMSHELRTPLNAIGGYVDLLLGGVRGPLPAPVVADLERVQRAEEHLLALINELLDIARLDAGELRYLSEPVPLARTVETVRALIEPQAAARGLALGWPEPCRGAVALADATRTE
ncbi:MAG TPA: histidine kinase dimerization/phospho-acceptor domain-containing protein, partial [Longimicrobiales bacterium]|nr:histidine kinase dimerization/phospho-acceptor domain-containing protein [Longimicrobiales bacterium]